MTQSAGVGVPHAAVDLLFAFTGRFPAELLAQEAFQGVPEARPYGTRYRLEYNPHRPHSALGHLTLAEFAAGCAALGFATLSRQPHSRSLTCDPLPDLQSALA